MKGYSTKEVADLLGLSPRQVRDYARSGVLDPERGPGNHYRFGFQDLVLLRTAKGLMDVAVPQRRIVIALRRLKEQLPHDRSLTAVRIAADGDEVVVRDGANAWAPASGQMHLVFDVADLAARAEPLAVRALGAAGERAESAAEWFDLGLELETHAPAQAREAFSRAVALEPGHADALLHLGRLFYEEGATEAAIVQYRRALEASGGGHASAAFHLGVALEDVGRGRAARDAFTLAVGTEPGWADAHYHLSLACERLGDGVSALRHMKAYRALQGS